MFLKILSQPTVHRITTQIAVIEVQDMCHLLGVQSPPVDKQMSPEYVSRVASVIAFLTANRVKPAVSVLHDKMDSSIQLFWFPLSQPSQLHCPTILQ